MKVLLTVAAGQLALALALELALAVNGCAPRAFAEGLLESGDRLLQVSTDFVFNGQQGSPYRPEQSRDPLRSTRSPRRNTRCRPSAPAIPCWSAGHELNRERFQPSLGC